MQPTEARPRLVGRGSSIAQDLRQVPEIVGHRARSDGDLLGRVVMMRRPVMPTMAPSSAHRLLDGGDAESRREGTVVGDGRAAPLHMSEHRDARFDPDPRLELLGDQGADAPETRQPFASSGYVGTSIVPGSGTAPSDTTTIENRPVLEHRLLHAPREQPSPPIAMIPSRSCTAMVSRTRSMPSGVRGAARPTCRGSYPPRGRMPRTSPLRGSRRESRTVAAAGDQSMRRTDSLVRADQESASSSCSPASSSSAFAFSTWYQLSS